MSAESDKRTRVVHVITGLRVGGAETVLTRLCTTSDRARFCHVVVSLESGGALVPRLRDAGIEVHELGATPGRLNPLALFALRRRVHELRPDVLQGWMYHGNLAALLGRTMTSRRVPVIWNVRQALYDMHDEKPLTALAIRVGAWLSWRTVAIIYNSETSAAQHESMGFAPPRTAIIPNGFDCAEFAPDAATRARTRAALSIGDSDVVVGLVARYHPIKDHRMFIDAVARAAAANPRIRALLVGRGVSHPNSGIPQELATHGLAESAIVLEESHDVVALCNAMDIACSSSRGEGFSNTIGEAMACGLPCVVTDVGDSARIVGETGRIVPRGDAGAFAAALLSMAALGREEREALGAAARRRIETLYSIGAAVARYESLYDRSTAHQPSSSAMAWAASL